MILLLGSACGAAAARSQQPSPAANRNPSPAAGSSTEVEVTLADNTITSSLTTFKVGVPYTFVIKNNGHHEHNFNINEPIAVTGSLDASLSSALLSVDQERHPDRWREDRAIHLRRHAPSE